MCEPTTILLYASLASAAAGAVQQQQNQSAQIKAQEKQLRANADSANAAFVSNVNQETRRQVEEEAVASDRVQQNNIEALQEIGTRAAATAGLGGILTREQSGEVIAADGRSTSGITRSLDSSQAQSEDRLAAFDAQRRSRILGANVAPVAGANVGQAFGTVIQGYALSKQLDSIQNPTDLTKSQRITS